AAQLVRQSMMPEQVATNLSASYHQSQAFSSAMRAYFKSRRLGQPGLMRSASLSSPISMQLASATNNPRFVANVVTAASNSNQLPWGESFEFNKTNQTNSTNSGAQMAPWGQPKTNNPAPATTTSHPTANPYGQAGVSSQPSRWGGFAVGYGIFTNLDTTDSSLGGKAKTYAGQFGVDYQLNDNWLAGISFTYAQGKIDYDQGRGNTDMTTYRVGPYISFTKDNWFINA